VRRHRERWGAHATPPRSATIEIVLNDEAVSLTIQISAAKIDRIRGLFAGKSDSEWVNELADELLSRFGIEVS
jgi:hypothetical protein